jgi:hypothetical protein
MLSATTKNKDKAVQISKIWLLNDISATMIIPASFARKYGLTKGEHVRVEDTGTGIFIKKLDLNSANERTD